MYTKFPVSLLELVMCPRDGGVLYVKDAPGCRDIENGLVQCSGCGKIFSIINGVLHLLKEKVELDPVQQKEQVARDRQVASGKGYREKWVTGDFKRMEIQSTLAHMPKRKFVNAVELGCGSGFLTVELLRRAQNVVAVDFSEESLRRLSDKIDGEGCIGLIKADITRIRLKPESFDFALSNQVVEHIPTAAARSQLYQTISSSLTARGEFLCTAYLQNIPRRICGKNAEGFHRSGIFYHYFGLRELSKEIGESLYVNHCHPIQIVVPLVRRIGIPRVWLSRVLEHVPALASIFGHLMIVVARKSAPQADLVS